MAIQIPPSAPDLQLPLTQRQEAAPVQPVSPVPGVAEQAQSLDSRVALRWAQPVLSASAPQVSRPATHAVGAYFIPQGPDPDAAADHPTHPMLAQGVTFWLSRVLGQAREAAPPQWPTPSPATPSDTPEAPASQASRATLVHERLQALFQSLAQSPVFAAHRLAHIVAPHRPGTQSNAPEAGTPDHATEANAAQWSTWIAALEPDSEAAQQAARWLTQGQLLLQTELVPGVPLRIWREDAWREHPHQPGQLEKGASLQVDVELPRMGPLRIVAQQWDHEMAIRLWHSPQAQATWQSAGPQLLDMLHSLGVGNVQWGPSTDTKEDHG